MLQPFLSKQGSLSTNVAFGFPMDTGSSRKKFNLGNSMCPTHFPPPLSLKKHLFYLLLHFPDAFMLTLLRFYSNKTPGQNQKDFPPPGPGWKSVPKSLAWMHEWANGWKSFTEACKTPACTVPSYEEGMPYTQAWSFNETHLRLQVQTWCPRRVWDPTNQRAF